MTDVSDAAFRWKKIDELETPVIKSKRVIKNISNWKKFKNSNFKGSRIIIYNLRNFIRFLKLQVISKKMSSKDLALSSEIANFTYKKLDSNNRINETNFSIALSIIENNFQYISNLAKENNAELYLIVFPWPETLIYGQSKFNWEKFAGNLCGKNNCKELINFFEDFNKIKEKTKIGKI